MVSDPIVPIFVYISALLVVFVNIATSAKEVAVVMESD
jgi:hypothetical protein